MLKLHTVSSPCLLHAQKVASPPDADVSATKAKAPVPPGSTVATSLPLGGLPASTANGVVPLADTSTGSTPFVTSTSLAKVAKRQMPVAAKVRPPVTNGS